MSYDRLTSGERYALSALRKQGRGQADIARAMHRHPSAIIRTNLLALLKGVL